MLPVSLLPAAGGQRGVVRPSPAAQSGAGEVWEILPRILGWLGPATVLVCARTDPAMLQPPGLLTDAFMLRLMLFVRPSASHDMGCGCWVTLCLLPCIVPTAAVVGHCRVLGFMGQLYLRLWHASAGVPVQGLLVFAGGNVLQSQSHRILARLASCEKQHTYRIPNGQRAAVHTLPVPLPESCAL